MSQSEFASVNCRILWLRWVSTKSVHQWRRTWRAGGQEAPASRGPGGSPCRLDEAQLAELRAALEAGPAAHGWADDQRWTQARAAALAALSPAGPVLRCQPAAIAIPHEPGIALLTA